MLSKLLFGSFQIIETQSFSFSFDCPVAQILCTSLACHLSPWLIFTSMFENKIAYWLSSCTPHKYSKKRRDHSNNTMVELP